MKNIKFRGQKDYCKEWTYGNLIQFTWADFIVKFGSFEDRQRVIPETVGQFTGLTDKNGREIYEGDIVQYEKVRNDWGKIIITIEKFEIEYNDCANYNQDEASKLEIIGNIHDNPELIK